MAYFSSSVHALVEWIASKSSVASSPPSIVIDSAPPGCSSRYSVQSKTTPLTAIHESSSALCAASSAGVMTRRLTVSGRFAHSAAPRGSLAAVDVAVFFFSGASTPFDGLAEPVWMSVVSGIDTRDTSSSSTTGGSTASGAWRCLTPSRAWSVIQPPGCWPGIVGCSARRTTAPLVCAAIAAVSLCMSTVNHGLLSMPMTFHVRFEGCVFIAESHARTRTVCADATSMRGSAMRHVHQPQYLPAGVGVLAGCETSSSAQRCHEAPLSSVTSTRITLRPPPEYAYPETS